MGAARSAGPSTVAAASRLLSTTSPVAAKKKKAKVPVKVENPDALPVDEAVRVLRALEVANPASAFQLEVRATPDKSGSILRGRVALPMDPRKAPDTIVVFVEPDTPAAKTALEAGAHYVGNDDLYRKILSGEVVPTKVISTAGALPGATRALARFLGPKGLMPAAKRGTVADGDELGEMVRNLAGTVEWKSDKWGYIRARK
ncbi:hypothetical protein VHUM_01439 [Vanrija humicola]|uniref:Ribosomal protein n=1 Tax=Vanrija humicola TaxID=5417 RepID=A0A7D8V3R5_VANHU|nr:hypothetical protein VHUM_01439 [Vanrija humicola]